MSTTADAILVATTGPVSVEREGTRINLAEGDSIYESDVINTGPDTTADIEFRDGTKSRLSPDTEMKLTDFDFGPGEEPSLVINLVEGAMRTVSGEIVKFNPEAFEVVTPSAVIGIRGTEFVNTVFPDGKEAHIVLYISEGKVMMVTRNDGQSVELTNWNMLNLDPNNPELKIEAIGSANDLEAVLEGLVPSLSGDVPENADEQGDWDELKTSADTQNEEQEAEEQATQEILADDTIQTSTEVSSVVLFIQEGDIAEDLMQSLENQTDIFIATLDSTPLEENINAEDVVVEDVVVEGPVVEIIPPIGGGGFSSPETPSGGGNEGDTVNLGSLGVYGDTEKNYSFGPGDDTIVGGQMAAYGDDAEINISTNSGNDSISLGPLEVIGKGEITIDAGNGNDNITVGDLSAFGDDSEITIEGGDGNDTILFNGKLEATNDGEITIDAGDGENVISLNGGFATSGGGTIELQGSDDDADEFTINTTGSSGTITIDGFDSGDGDTLDLTGLSYDQIRLATVDNSVLGKLTVTYRVGEADAFTVIFEDIDGTSDAQAAYNSLLTSGQILSNGTAIFP